MPLSEHEQRLLDQIERALYAEDPKFVSTVRGGRLHRPSRRRRLQGIAVFVLGLILLVLGVVIPVKPADIPVVSVVGFLVMFGGAVLVLSAMRGGSQEAESEGEGSAGPASGGDRKKSEPRARGSFAQRMEERFRKRFEQ
ncbi:MULTISPECIES: DUF3040 domain-containing protein [Saccharopolyspora]|uniref:DUF3040 domain-containing protein n=1 Tax=Saccharopolyspora gregorii TaxID=33914 RepID=A0ABP6RKT2_9PSEU|nr:MULTISPECIES: DUF3040 domain-containing protein [Saccharopolyspora]MCA1186928.1 DUF3040 domain-containing protein [Saccharopolyspora sp. 6T]MCA1193309.1 DUF3040 domain-containing protein [Saccharopolyspora sp. 6V]MCA1228924.1 DUF3040 domain-containing protein [Saccharopolyspora sp. 6M]MCA1281412.1 DUF3040 domain-containing protein [Saccharopolyspora sp. 7B]